MYIDVFVKKLIICMCKCCRSVSVESVDRKHIIAYITLTTGSVMFDEAAMNAISLHGNTSYHLNYNHKLWSVATPRP